MRKKNLLYLLLFPLGIHLFTLSCLHFNEHFNPKDFEHGFDSKYAIKMWGLDHSHLEALNQPYHFLSQGKQMTAFESSDGKYVLKVFNPMRPLKHHWYLSPKQWLQSFSIKGISSDWFEKKDRFKKLFKRFQLAHDYLHDETGLLFVHLSYSDRINHLVHVTDKKGNTQILTMNQTPFVLQKKATLVPEHLKTLLKQNQFEEAKHATALLEKLFERRLQVGITDRIQTMENNYGFVDGQPIQIDIGRIRLDHSLLDHPEGEKQRIQGNFQEWLSKHFPALN